MSMFSNIDETPSLSSNQTKEGSSFNFNPIRSLSKGYRSKEDLFPRENSSVTREEQDASSTLSTSQPTTIDEKLKEIIQHLHKHPITEEEEATEGQTSSTGYFKWITLSRKFLRNIMNKATFHYIIIVLIITDLIIVFIELVLSQLSIACLNKEQLKHYNTSKQPEHCLLLPTKRVETADEWLYYISLSIISIFVIELLCGLYAFGWRRYIKFLYLFDAIIVITSFILEIYFHFGTRIMAGNVVAALVVLRLWKIIRVIHAVAESIILKNHIAVEKIEKARTILSIEKAKEEKIILEQKKKIKELLSLLENTNINKDNITQSTDQTT